MVKLIHEFYHFLIFIYARYLELNQCEIITKKKEITHKRQISFKLQKKILKNIT